MKPLVSICVLSYNNSEYIEETLDSVISQNYRPLELLIHDDCSSDSSSEVINRWISKQSEMDIVFVEAMQNIGVCKSLNKLIKQSKGDNLCSIGSDDYYEHDFLRKRVDFLESCDSNGGLCYSWSKTIYEDGSGRDLHLEKREDEPSGFIFEDNAKGVSSLTKPLTLLVKKDVYNNDGYFDESLMYEDLDWFLRVSKKYKIEYFDSNVTIYREQIGTLGTKIFTTARGIQSQLDVISKHVGFSKEADGHFIRRLLFLCRKAWAIDNATLLDVALFWNKRYPALKSYIFYVNAKLKSTLKS
jgi:glycosyltransferase involved in cell wall biosynthesis